MPPSGESPVVDVHNSRVEQDGHEWVLRTLADGEWRVLSRHGTQEQAEAAQRAINASSPTANDDEGPKA
jgi:hypothetical protein